MKEVEIIFANLQSHEHTQFTLRPGLNFILAEDNNVGKSTIFKVLSTVAKAPTNSGASIDRLIRTGTAQGYAAFKYDGQRVVAWFKRGTTPGSAKLFFEHVGTDGSTTRHLSCPASLLDALGIVVGENEDVINFNDADSVQLIAKNTADSDAIITHVMLDQTVEHIKENMYRFSKDLVADDKLVSARIETAEEMLSELHYNPVVDEFNETVGELEATCKLLDGGLCPVEDSRDYGDVGVLHGLLNFLLGLEDFAESASPAEFSSLDYALLHFCNAFAEIDLDKVDRPVVTRSDIREADVLVRMCSALYPVVCGMREVEKDCSAISYNEREKEKLKAELERQSKDIVCPVKGRVYYSSEECIPRSD